MNSHFSALILAAWLLAGATPPPVAPPAGPGPAQAQLSSLAAPDRWVHVTPSALGKSGQLFPVGEKATTVTLPGIPPGIAMVCAGGEKAATQCERLLIEEGGTVVLGGPVAGVRLTGGLRLGRNPEAGAEISLVPKSLAFRKQFAVPIYKDGKKLVWRITTDAKGRFTVPLVAPGEYQLGIRTHGGRLEQGEPFTVPPPAKLLKKDDPPGTVPVLDLGELALAEGLEVAVTVTDEAGRPVVGAGVGGSQGKLQKTVFFEAHSDSAGNALLAPLDPTLPAKVVCVARGFNRLEQSFDAPPTAVRCVLAPLSGIEGKVIDDGDRPIAEATVALLPKDATARTGKDGVFYLENLSPGERRLTVAAPGFKAARQTVHLGTSERRKLEPIRLEKAAGLAGKVVDGTSKEPIAGAVVSVVDPEGFAGATTGEDGAFTLAAAGAPLRVSVAAQGYPQTTLDVGGELSLMSLSAGVRVRQASLPADFTGSTLDLPLPGASVAGGLQDHGKPVAGARLTLRSAAGEDIARLATDGGGGFQIPYLPDGSYSLLQDGRALRSFTLSAGKALDLGVVATP